MTYTSTVFLSTCCCFTCAVEEVFSELSARPLGAASLAQCHRGVLVSDGRTVAVKIQHPDVGRNAYTDMNTMDVRRTDRGRGGEKGF